MFKGPRRGGRASGRLRENEAALDYSLDMQREAFRGPVAAYPILAHGGVNIGFQRLCVDENVSSAGAAHVRMSAVCFLNDGSREAAEVGQIANQCRLAKINVGEETIERIVGLVIRRVGEEIDRKRIPAGRRRQPEVFLAGEVMKKATLGDARLGADVFDPRRCVPLGTNHL